MSDWPKTTLGAVLPFKYGKNLPEPARSHTGEFQVMSSAGLVDTHFEPLTVGPAVVIGRKGSVGTVYYSGEPVFPIDTTFYVEGSIEMDLRFAYYLLTWLPLKSMNSDSAVPGLNRTHAEGIEINLPPPDEQRVIAGTLGALDDKIESNRRTIDLAEDLADELFRWHAKGAVSLSDVAALTMGSSPPGHTYNEIGEGIPFYQGVRDFGRRFPGYRVWTTGAVRLSHEDDTLVSVRAPVGKLNRSRETCCIGRGVAAISSDFPSSIYYALRATEGVWRPFQQEGTVFGAINKTDLSNAQIAWPDRDILSELESRLLSIDEKIRSLSVEIESLTAFRDSLLPELLSGRVRVREPEGALV